MTAFIVGTGTQRVSYARKVGKYRDDNTGRFVSRDRILRLVDEEVARLATRMKAHARNLTAGNIDLPTFQQRAVEDLKLSHVRMAILGSGGKSLTTSAQYGATGRLLREQYNYFDGFARDLAAGKLTKAQAIQRASLYGASTRSAFHQSEKIARGREGFKLASRVLDAGAQHCPSCLRYSTNGLFVPIEQIISPGVNCECRFRCRCRIEWKKDNR
ncbi:hypothetical protein [Chroococcidiopsis sp.]|uniref:hypothetical protein n=1 Tax=Chroococcidiopsis sp. TaxID=3088168 RepID=UPI003F400091